MWLSQLKFHCRSGDENISVSFLTAPDLNLTIAPSNHDVCLFCFLNVYLISLFIRLAGGGNNLGQVVYTHVPLSPGSIILCQSRDGDVLRLALHWPCITNLSGLSICRLKAQEKEMSTLLTLLKGKVCPRHTLPFTCCLLVTALHHVQQHLQKYAL